LNHNRHWHEDQQAEVVALRRAMLADTGGRVDVVFDFHAYGAASGFLIYNDSPTYPPSAPFLDAFRTLEPGITVDNEGQTSYPDTHPGDFGIWVTRPGGLQSPLSFTPECSQSAGARVERFELFGQHVAEALFRLLEP
jgi:hypothetical protein